MFGLSIGAISVCAYAANNPVAEAVDRGLAGKSTPASRGSKISPEQWRRKQLAAVDRAEQLMRKARRQSGLLAQYALMRASYAADDEPVFRQIFGQYVSWFQTWIGDYDGARASFSIAQSAQTDDANSPLSDAYRPTPAMDAILKLSANRQAVFFNEAHSAPLTRTLTVRLLAGLRARGFTHFAAETLSVKQIDSLRQGYPTGQSGFYLDEPIYAEMVRAAIRLGFKIIAYDADDLADSDVREKAAAQSLIDQVFKNDPQARLIVNAGYSHIQKSGKYLGGMSMAEYFQKISAIEPLAIEQTMMIEHVRSEDEHPVYRAALQAGQQREPFVFSNAQGKAWSLKPGRYDVSVFFPRETQLDGRPDWISLSGARKSVSISTDECAGELPCLIEAKYANEGSAAVAADRVAFETRPAQSRPLDGGATRAPRVLSRLYLFPGTYRISALRANGQGIATRSLTVDADAASLAIP